MYLVLYKPKNIPQGRPPEIGRALSCQRMLAFLSAVVKVLTTCSGTFSHFVTPVMFVLQDAL